MAEKKTEQDIGKRCAENAAAIKSVAAAVQEARQSALLDAISLRRDVFARVDAAQDAIAGIAAEAAGRAAEAEKKAAETAAALESRLVRMQAVLASVNSAVDGLSRALADSRSALSRQASAIAALASDAAAAKAASANILAAQEKAATGVRNATGEIKSAVAQSAKNLAARIADAVDETRRASEGQTSALSGIASEASAARAAAEAARDAAGAARKTGEESAAALGVDIRDKANAVMKTINDTRYLYWYPGEVESAEARGLCDLAKRPGFEREYEALTANLDAESVATVDRTINRLARIKGLKGRADIYTEEEKVLLRKVDAFGREVLSVSPQLHCWRGYRLPKNHFSPSVFLYRYGLDLLTNPAAFRDRDAIDAGAYIGDSALVLSEYVGGRIFCFEASAANFALLRKTVEMNGLKRVVAENVALGAEQGEARLRECADRSSFDAQMVPSPQSVETCRVTTLDGYVEEHSIDVGLIKVDIEGAERGFLKGAERTIRKHRPTLLVSIYHTADDFMTIKPMIEEMGLGYEMRIYRPTIRSVVAETLLVCEQPKPRRAAARRKEAR